MNIGKCIHCGFNVSNKDTHKNTEQGIICGVCQRNLALDIDIPSTLERSKKYTQKVTQHV